MQINPILLFRVEKDFGCREALSEYITTVFRSFFTYLTNAFLTKTAKIYKLFPSTIILWRRYFITKFT